MRSLSIALLAAWAAVATQLIYLPPEEVERDLVITKAFLENMKKAEPAFLQIPEVVGQIKDADELVADPTLYSIAIWLKWVGRLFLVLFGFWGAFSLFRGRSSARLLVVIASLLFLARQLIFSFTGYKMLFRGSSAIPYLLRTEKYEFASWIIWWEYVLPLFFLFSVIWLLLSYRTRTPGLI